MHGRKISPRRPTARPGTSGQRVSGRVRAQFDAAYVRRYYLDPRTRVVSAREMRDRARVIAATLAHAGIGVRSILDAGCGIGLLEAPFAELLPQARYIGLELSEYLCRRYGWIQGSLTDYAPRTPSDLLVCYDVLQYLSDDDAERAIARFAGLTRAALYVSALTRADWRLRCDQRLTDRAVHVRTARWYRVRLERRFRYLGLGVWLRRDVRPMLWEMEGPF